MTNVYIVSTPYHLLISIIKTILSNRIGKDFIIMYTNHLSPITLKRAELIFKKSFCYNRMDILSNLISLKLSQIPFFSHLVRQKYGLNENWYKKNQIFIFNDNSYFGCLLNTYKIEYNLIEDALNFYRHNPLELNHHSKLYDLLGFHWDYLSQSKFTKTIEINNTQNLWLKSTKIIVCDREKMFKSLEKKDVEKIAEIFDYHPLNMPDYNEKTLLLTQPLDEGLMTRSKKIRIYKYLVEKYAIGKLYIKVHPREKEDYSKIFPEAIILGNQSIPFEAYQLIENFKFKRAITTFSAVIDAIFCAEEKITMGLEWTKNFK